MEPVASETVAIAAETMKATFSLRARRQVRHVSSDDPSHSMWTEFQKIFPNMETLCASLSNACTLGQQEALTPYESFRERHIS
jgi:hypothetical protein